MSEPWILLSEEACGKEREAHRHKLEPWVMPHLKRQELDQTHAVYDFLFSYYSFRASLLMRWTPGLGFCMQGKSASFYLQNSDFVQREEGVVLDLNHFPYHRREAIEWTLALLEKTAARPKQFGCSGLHEWAMEYESKNKRYPEIPLRMSPRDLKVFVASQKVCCTHYDAYRFFTPSAKPLNSEVLSKISQPEFEQAGCLHVNMDLYKWAYKFYPWISSNLIADAFLLALEIREIDMRASPYDLRHLGFQSIPVETSTGRAEYQRLQCAMAEKAEPIRQRLIEAYHKIIAYALDGPTKIHSTIEF